jgi:nucleotide-binding universal stress UspA family protein
MMRHTPPPSPSVVVGIDGSRSAITAALWAVDEAVERDIPLRLVYALEPDGASESDPHDTARRLACADITIREAIVAVESTEATVKIEVEILRGRPEQVLLEASSSAAMICVGALGLHHTPGTGVGSTAATLAAVAQCPVAIIRGYRQSSANPGWIVAEVDESPSGSYVLERAADEARLRAAPLRMLPTTTHGTALNYLARHAESIQLVVAGRRRSPGLADVVGPLKHASLHDTNCSVLICEPRATS